MVTPLDGQLGQDGGQAVVLLVGRQLDRLGDLLLLAGLEELLDAEGHGHRRRAVAAEGRDLLAGLEQAVSPDLGRVPALEDPVGEPARGRRP